MKLYEFGALKPEQIYEFEKRLNVHFPEDYRRFLMETGGGIVELDETNAIYIDDVQDTIVIDALYGILDKNKYANMEFWMKKYADDLYENTIIIGDSIMHGFIVIIYEGEDQGVYYWDDMYHFEESNDESNVYFIAETFTDFLKLLE